MRGTITKLFTDRGFGFAEQEDGLSVFICWRDVATGECFDALGVGDVVDFLPTQTEKGPRGVDIRRVR